MVRKEQFALGAGLVASAFAFILTKLLAWFVLALGVGLILDFYLRDFIWGPDRLTKEQIRDMPAEEYKNRVLGNPKTEWWVNWRLTGYDAFKKQMRKLAREAVIFMLLTPIVFVAGRFSFLSHAAHTAPIDISAGLVPKNPSNIPPPPPGFTPIEPPKQIEGLPPGAIVIPIRTVPPTLSTFDMFVSALWFGVYGAPAGLGFWLLYRAIRFAIKG